jgi:hypothetical protein
MEGRKAGGREEQSLSVNLRQAPRASTTFSRRQQGPSSGSAHAHPTQEWLRHPLFLNFSSDGVTELHCYMSASSMAMLKCLHVPETSF